MLCRCGAMILLPQITAQPTAPREHPEFIHCCAPSPQPPWSPLHSSCLPVWNCLLFLALFPTVAPQARPEGVQHLSFGFFQRQSPKPNSIMLVCAQSWATAQPGHWRGLTGGWDGERGRKERFWGRQWGSPSQCTPWSCTNLAEVTQTSKAGQSQPPQHTAPQGTGLFRGEKRHPSFSAVCSSKMYFQLNCKSLQSPSPGSSLGTGECSVRVLLSWCPTPNRDSESRGDFSPAQSPALQVGLTRLCLAGRIQG